ncbi:MAG: hypothetical protein AABO41_20920 [Acidobacteriota bacterium]
MKSSRPALLFAALLTASACLMVLPVWLGGRAAEQAVNENGGSKMPGQADEPSGAGSARGQSTLISRAAGPIVLGASPVRISLPPEKDAKGLAARLDKLEPGRSIYLVLRDLSTTEQPGVLYHVYLDLPAGAAPEKNDPRYVDSVSFFDAGGAKPSDGTSFRSFDITSVARTLKTHKLLTDQTAITIVPGGTPAAEAKPTIGGVELVEQ